MARLVLTSNDKTEKRHPLPYPYNNTKAASEVGWKAEAMPVPDPLFQRFGLELVSLTKLALAHAH